MAPDISTYNLIEGCSQSLLRSSNCPIGYSWSSWQFRAKAPRQYCCLGSAGPEMRQVTLAVLRTFQHLEQGQPKSLTAQNALGKERELCGRQLRPAELKWKQPVISDLEPSCSERDVMGESSGYRKVKVVSGKWKRK